MYDSPSSGLRRHAERGDRCEVCGSEIEKRMFRIVVPHWQGTFDCMECALTVADRGASGAGPLSQAEELAAELFVARLAGESTKARERKPPDRDGPPRRRARRGAPEGARARA